jgi:UDP-N-acetylmuramoyl-tripeptide--D-alanyl-D-alanine ligase
MTAPLWTAREVTNALGLPAGADWTASGVSIDSRAVEPGDLFVAIEGPNADGHDFVADALAKGAVAAVVHHAPTGVAGDAPLLLVDDSLAALAALGRAARARTGARIVAVTGSVGKTGSKEALNLVLGAQAPTSANLSSLNNHWGLPLSLARMPRDTVFGILEMGMNHPGEITPLSILARPHAALITAVEAVHAGFFASVDEIADAKAEVFAGLEPRGTAVLNRDNPHFARLAKAAMDKGATTIIGFGAHADASIRLIDSSADAGGSDVVARIGGQDLRYRIGVPGHHWIINSLGVLATVSAVGGDVRAAAAALPGMTAPVGRGRRHTVKLGSGGFELIDESYNASPVSMNAAFQVLGTAKPGPGGRRIAVIGDMLELGDASADLHGGLLAPLTEHGIELVFAAGPFMSHLWERLPEAMRGARAANSAELTPLISAAVRAGDVITVKGSLGSRMGPIVTALRALGGGA